MITLPIRDTIDSPPWEIFYIHLNVSNDLLRKILVTSKWNFWSSFRVNSSLLGIPPFLSANFQSPCDFQKYVKVILSTWFEESLTMVIDEFFLHCPSTRQYVSHLFQWRCSHISPKSLLCLHHYYIQFLDAKLRQQNILFFSPNVPRKHSCFYHCNFGQH